MVKISNISKTLGSQTILDGIDLSIEAGEFFSFLGPSGCGKTTLLRIIAGLETADTGTLQFQGHDITYQPAQKRPFHMVFQGYALFPHMTVFDNVAFGLKIKKMETCEILQKVKNILSLVQLDGFEERRPESLSGGQAQRVALARALVNEPQLVLLDEPLSALDAQLRHKMRTELKMLQKKLGITFINVTHDLEEAFEVSDRLAVLNQGRIEQLGPPQDIFKNPRSEFVAEFIRTKRLQ